jgi:hypothetical protein
MLARRKRMVGPAADFAAALGAAADAAAGSTINVGGAEAHAASMSKLHVMIAVRTVIIVLE